MRRSFRDNRPKTTVFRTSVNSRILKRKSALPRDGLSNPRGLYPLDKSASRLKLHTSSTAFRSVRGFHVEENPVFLIRIFNGSNRVLSLICSRFKDDQWFLACDSCARLEPASTDVTGVRNGLEGIET